MKSYNDRKIIATEMILLIALCVMFTLGRKIYVDFVPINGTFQDFNPVRRFLNGQIPYKDFTDYLGLGHLYWGSFFTAVLGGKYRSSLLAFSFLSIFCAMLTSFLISNAVFENKRSSMAFTIAIIKNPSD